ncbi:MAG: hypothetical protein LUF92_12230 [Clostridiales bacterium]|nr:hypothetical protein [Clostridiales bacterium]
MINNYRSWVRFSMVGVFIVNVSGICQLRNDAVHFRSGAGGTFSGGLSILRVCGVDRLSHL